ncbi:response regulator transcription factor [Ktedonobacter robiniae]|uniref:DNA-binding response regulator n=1 Tax=Ktedonobacter robiniae TaxID=2778365 RepID=A0ABQ3V598_9CHLR|nr:response regulator transcription factor [Ktedonobacter robiniae]GHO60142.1 DNA-binding response regulator [Ktedonobacter robiniae]
MTLSVLVAEAQDVLRAGLRAIFTGDCRVTRVDEVTTEKEAKQHLLANQFDLVVMNQSLLTDPSCLAKNVVLLAAEPDIAVLKEAYKCGALGYLSVNVSSELLKTMLHPAGHAFLIEPTLIPWVMEYILHQSVTMVRHDLLTPREREIVGLLREGVDRPSIAKQLSIAETTLKTHIKNISKKGNGAKTL